MTPIYRLTLSIYGLIGIVAGLFYWVSRPGEGAPTEQLQGAAAVIGLLVTIAAGSGVAAMATVQFWKVVFRPRSTFHEQELRNTFGSVGFHLLDLTGPEIFYRQGPFRNYELSVSHLLDNPTEIVMGQLRSAADFVLMRPERFEGILIQLVGERGRDAVARYLSLRSLRSDVESRRDEDPTAVNDALVELRFLVEQRLNLMHVGLKERWRRRVRLVAVAVAGSSGLLMTVLSDLGPSAKLSAVFAAVVWGGFFSWLSRDLVALVERRRT